MKWCLKNKTGKPCVVRYLDDFLLAGRVGTATCQYSLHSFEVLVVELGVLLAPTKIEGQGECSGCAGTHIPIGLVVLLFVIFVLQSTLPFKIMNTSPPPPHKCDILVESEGNREKLRIESGAKVYLTNSTYQAYL